VSHFGFMLAHTFDHIDLSASRTLDELWEQVRRNDVAITNVLGQSFAPRFIRAPYGKLGPDTGKVFESWGYKVVWNNLDNLDTVHADPAKFSPQAQYNLSMLAFEKTFNSSNPKRDSFIALAHNQINITATRWTESIIGAVKKRGFRFVSLGEWYPPLI
jgi:peptidoglycan/xylan/chitin deacetylase (PgdA/CDA1 family)